MYDSKEVMAAVWKTPGTKESFSTSEVFTQIKNFVKDPNYSGYQHDIAVGSDSQMIGQKFQFISVISVHRVGKGGLYFFSKDYVPRERFPVGIQKLRMFDEVARSCAVGQEIKNTISLSPEIHIDASPPHKKEEFTSKFSEQLRGYVQSYGFTCMLKPESYVAHAIADRHTKKRVRKRKALKARLAKQNNKK